MKSINQNAIPHIPHSKVTKIRLKKNKPGHATTMTPHQTTYTPNATHTGLLFLLVIVIIGTQRAHLSKERPCPLPCRLVKNDHDKGNGLIFTLIKQVDIVFSFLYVNANFVADLG